MSHVCGLSRVIRSAFEHRNVMMNLTRLQCTICGGGNEAHLCALFSANNRTWMTFYDNAGITVDSLDSRELSEGWQNNKSFTSSPFVSHSKRMNHSKTRVVNGIHIAAYHSAHWPAQMYTCMMKRRAHFSARLHRVGTQLLHAVLLTWLCFTRVLCGNWAGVTMFTWV